MMLFVACKRRITSCAWSNLRKKFFNLLERDNNALLLDCGCGNGEITVRVAKHCGVSEIYGIDIVNDLIKRAKNEGVVVIRGDLNSGFPLRDNCVNGVFANQVIEHLINLNDFCDEVHRVLKPGGYALISTPNLGSWPNIFALLLGYQPFSLAVFAKKRVVGNPLAGGLDPSSSSYEEHMKALTYASLKGMFEIRGFNVIKICGSGYAPFFGIIARVLSFLDVRHAEFLLVKIRK